MQKRKVTTKAIANPYLPGWEYIPDGEPHVFENRIYVFGSHDRAHGTAFCQEDYVAWSAPTDDLSNWFYHGVIYRKDQDPHNKQVMKELWAPDVCQGSDGRYYLYYCRAFSPEIGIAVADVPYGPYKFYDYVRDKNGQIWSQDLPFDPGVLYEDPEHIWLYTGFGADPVDLPEDLTLEDLRQREYFKDFDDISLQKIYEQGLALRHPSENASCLRLAADMKTVLNCTAIAPAKKNSSGTSFEEHPFFEASSIRKINDTYYFVYSSLQGHELCYATSLFPDKDFTFRGVIISNADLGYNNNRIPLAYHANNHGGLVKIQDQWFIFYHRHTNKTLFSRQGCAEPVSILSDGSIPQVEMTSSGLNNGPLPADSPYSAHICCNLIGPEGACNLNETDKINERTPYITEETNGAIRNQYISNMRNGAICGFKYFLFKGETKLFLTLRGKGRLNFCLDDTGSEPLSFVTFISSDWNTFELTFPPVTGIHAVYLIADSDTKLDISSLYFK